MGYSTQEILITRLIENKTDKLVEFPNIIFFQKNKGMRTYSEVDMVILAKEEISYQHNKVYYKAEYENDKITKTKVEEGEALKFERNSINFVEIKNSIKGLLKDFGNENKNAQKDEKINKTPSDFSSFVSGKKNEQNLSTHYRHVSEFMDLYKSFKILYEKINMIYLIDSYFSRDFFNEVEKFIVKYASGKLNYPF